MGYRAGADVSEGGDADADGDGTEAAGGGGAAAAAPATELWVQCTKCQKYVLLLSLLFARLH